MISLGILFGCFACVIVTMLTSILHKFDIHKFDKYLCKKCICFWLTLALTLNPLVASVAALFIYFVDKYDNNKETTL